MADNPKVAIEDTLKALLDLRKALVNIPEVAPIEVEDPDDPDTETLLAQIRKEIAEVRASQATLVQTLSEIGRQGTEISTNMTRNWKSFLAKVDAELGAAVKSYQAAVKNSGGLTAQKPSVTRALDSLAKDPKAALIDAAIKELNAHLAEVEKANAKDKAKAKSVAAFGKAIDAICADLKQL